MKESIKKRNQIKIFNCVDSLVILYYLKYFKTKYTLELNTSLLLNKTENDALSLYLTWDMDDWDMDDATAYGINLSLLAYVSYETKIAYESYKEDHERCLIDLDVKWAICIQFFNDILLNGNIESIQISEILSFLKYTNYIKQIKDKDSFDFEFNLAESSLTQFIAIVVAYRFILEHFWDSDEIAYYLKTLIKLIQANESVASYIDKLKELKRYMLISKYKIQNDDVQWCLWNKLILDYKLKIEPKKFKFKAQDLIDIERVHIANTTALECGGWEYYKFIAIFKDNDFKLAMENKIEQFFIDSSSRLVSDYIMYKNYINILKLQYRALTYVANLALKTMTNITKSNPYNYMYYSYQDSIKKIKHLKAEHLMHAKAIKKKKFTKSAAYNVYTEHFKKVKKIEGLIYDVPIYPFIVYSDHFLIHVVTLCSDIYCDREEVLHNHNIAYKKYLEDFWDKKEAEAEAEVEAEEAEEAEALEGCIKYHNEKAAAYEEHSANEYIEAEEAEERERRIKNLANDYDYSEYSEEEEEEEEEEAEELERIERRIKKHLAIIEKKLLSKSDEDDEERLANEYSEEEEEEEKHIWGESSKGFWSSDYSEEESDEEWERRFKKCYEEGLVEGFVEDTYSDKDK